MCLNIKQNPFIVPPKDSAKTGGTPPLFFPDLTKGQSVEGSEPNSTPATIASKVSVNIPKTGSSDANMSLIDDQVKQTDKPARESMVPEQKIGMATNNEVSKTYDSKTIDKSFEAAKKKFFDINNWEATANSSSSVFNTSAEFKLFDDKGKPVSGRVPKAGDQIRMDLPGPGGYNWVRIEEVKNTDSEVAIRFRPQEGKHWYTKDATNTFVLSKDGNNLNFGVYGRNEETSNNPLHIAINKGGQLTGMQSTQLKELGKGMLP